MSGDPRQHRKRRERGPQILPRPAESLARVDLQPDELSDRGERVAEQEAGPVGGAEQVADRRERTPLEPLEQHGRAPRPVQSSLDFGQLEIWVDLVADADEAAVPLQVGDALAEVEVSHAATGERKNAGKCFDDATDRATLRLPRTR